MRVTVLAVYAIGILVSLPMSLVPLSALFGGRGFVASFDESVTLFARHPVAFLTYGAIAFALLALGLMTMGIGLVIALPLIACADLRRVARPRPAYADAACLKSIEARVRLDLVDVEAVDARGGRAAPRPATARSTASSAPCTHASTVPSRRLRTQPVTPSRVAASTIV